MIFKTIEDIKRCANKPDEVLNANIISYLQFIQLKEIYLQTLDDLEIFDMKSFNIWLNEYFESNDMVTISEEQVNSFRTENYQFLRKACKPSTDIFIEGYEDDTESRLEQFNAECNDVIKKFPSNEPECKLRILKNLRQQKRDLGIITNDIQIQTDETSVTVMSSYISETVINGLIDINWKCNDDTYHKYIVQEFKEVYKCVIRYVESCFNREAELIAELETNPDADITTGWPDRTYTY